MNRFGKKRPGKHWPLFLGATIALVLVLHFYFALFRPASREKVWKEIEVTEGMSLKTIATTLQKEGIVRYPGYLRILGRLRGVSRRIRTGYYGLNTNMSLWEVLEALRKGKVIEYEVVIPEGYNLYQIAWTLAKTPLINEPHEFVDLVKNKDYVHSLGIQADSLEGYLYPDTYFLPKGIKLEEIPKRMVQRYRAVFVESYRERAAEIGMTEHQVVTLASIIEKEAKVPSERKLISAVYHNRLKKGMKLQADPTCVYGTKAWINVVTREDLKRRSPYNTYLHRGLPPGPIANPGAGSILAALYPEQVDYLFFVAQGDGSHYFSDNYHSHEKAVGRYWRNKKKAQQDQPKHQAALRRRPAKGAQSPEQPGGE